MYYKREGVHVSGSQGGTLAGRKKTHRGIFDRLSNFAEDLSVTTQVPN
jgi:hypothetical protein